MQKNKITKIISQNDLNLNSPISSKNEADTNFNASLENLLNASEELRDYQFDSELYWESYKTA